MKKLKYQLVNDLGLEIKVWGGDVILVTMKLLCEHGLNVTWLKRGFCNKSYIPGQVLEGSYVSGL